jgi:hypothetical protein
MLKVTQIRTELENRNLEKPPSDADVRKLLFSIVLDMTEAQLKRALMAILAGWSPKSAILNSLSPIRTPPK